jgi:hypothetical protein
LKIVIAASRLQVQTTGVTPAKTTLGGFRWRSLRQREDWPCRVVAFDANALDREDPPIDEDLDSREAERIRRRDREASAEDRDLMRPGMGKVFKQILDRQGRVAKEPPKRRGKTSG